MSIFPTTILLATDGSEEAQLAATTAADLAEKTNSELHVTTVGAGLPISAAAEEIAEVAEEIDAGLLVMGSRGHSRLRRALMGSVSDAVVRHAHCPVTIVRK